MKNISVVTIKDKFALFNDLWSPKIIGELNDSYIKIAKIRGEFVWHSHENEDEYFQVIKGNLTIQFRDKDLHISEGEMVVIPKGVEHRPVAVEEVHIMMIEPKSTLNTGNVNNERTLEELNWI